MKLDYLYTDTKHDLGNVFKRHRQELNNNNIASFNDYITDDVIGEGGFKHPLVAF